LTQVIRQERVPLPVVKKILEEMKEVLGDNPIVARAYEHASRFSKCSPETALEATQKLREIGFSDVASVMLVNLLPEELEEAKALLGDIDGGYDDEKIEKALETLNSLCRGETGE